MPRPTRRTYLAVLAAFLIVGGVGGYLAANWRGLAAAYYLRKAADPKADYETVREVLAKARRYDRARVVEFWRKEMAEINRKAEPGKSTDGLIARLELAEGDAVIEGGAPIRATVIFRNTASREVKLPSMDWIIGYDVSGGAAIPIYGVQHRVEFYPLYAWLARRGGVDLPNYPLVYGAITNRENTVNRPKFLAPGEEWRYTLESYLDQSHIGLEKVQPGFYRVRLHSRLGLSTNWGTIRVMPEGDELEWDLLYWDSSH